MQKIQQRRKGKFLKKINVLKRKMQAAEEAEDEVKFLKQARMDQTSIAKMQCPTFKLNQEDTDIIRKNAMLTHHQIQMAQELLHRQFPHIKGLLSPTIGNAKQFPVMQNNFIQVLHTGGPLRCDCYLVMVERLVSLSEPESYAGRRFISPGRATHARKVDGESPE